MIMFKIRSTTIKFASANKKEEIKREQSLIKKINYFEKNEENTYERSYDTFEITMAASR